MRDLPLFIREYFAKTHPSDLGLTENPSSISIVERKAYGPSAAYEITANSEKRILSIDSGRYSSKSEFDKLKALEEFKIAPRAFKFDEYSIEAPFIITEMLPGKSLSKEEIGQNLELVLNSIDSLSKIDISKLGKNHSYKNINTDYYDSAYDLLMSLKPDIGLLQGSFGNNEFIRFSKEFINNADLYLQKNHTSFKGTKLSLVHSLLHGRNIILDDNKNIKFVNWANSSISDPALEISKLIGLNGLGKEDSKRIIKRYSLGDSSFEERVIFYSQLSGLDFAIEYARQYSKSCSLDSKRKFFENIEEFLKGDIIVGVSDRKKKRFLDDKKEISAGQTIKYFLKKSATAGLAALSLYAGACYDQRRPIIVDHYDNVAGAGLDIIGRINYNFPTIPLVEELVWPEDRSQAVKQKDGKLSIQINEAQSERRGKYIQDNWDLFAKNHEYLEKGFIEWQASKEVMFQMLKDLPRSEIKRRFMEESFKATLAHEIKHIEDKVDKYNVVDSETRAYLKEMEISPFGLYEVEGITECKECYSKEYHNAANRILAELKDYHKSNTMRELYGEEKLFKSLPDFSKDTFKKLYRLK